MPLNPAVKGFLVELHFTPETDDGDLSPFHQPPNPIDRATEVDRALFNGEIAGFDHAVTPSQANTGHNYRRSFAATAPTTAAVTASEWCRSFHADDTSCAAGSGRPGTSRWQASIASMPPPPQTRETTQAVVAFLVGIIILGARLAHLVRYAMGTTVLPAASTRTVRWVVEDGTIAEATLDRESRDVGTQRTFEKIATHRTLIHIPPPTRAPAARLPTHSAPTATHTPPRPLRISPPPPAKSGDGVQHGACA